MGYRIKYRHPNNGNTYYFVDLCERGSNLVPIGVFDYRKRLSTIFAIKHDACQVVFYLESLGYSAWLDINFIRKE